MRCIWSILFGFLVLLSDAQTEKADSLFTLGNYKQALQNYLLAYDAIKDNAFQNNRIGYCYHKLDDYKNARKYYEIALGLRPAKGIEAIVRSRMSRICALEKKKEESINNLNQAVGAGYSNLNELKFEKDFDNIRKSKRFVFITDSLYKSLCPCLNDPRKNEFDFWLGEWDVVTTQGFYPAGKSKVEKVSDNCLVLENWTSSNGTSGKSMNYIDPSTNKWEQTWSGSGGEITKFVNGVYDGNEMQFEFKRIINGIENIGKFHFYKLERGKVRQMEEVSPDGGKTWKTTYDLTYIPVESKTNIKSVK